MSVLPDTNTELVAFCESHSTAWSSAPPTNIGLTVAQVTAFENLCEAARAALGAQTDAKNAAKAATTQLNQNLANLRNSASDLIRVIKGYAAMQTNPGTIYAIAQIPEPATPTPATAPGKPDKISVNLEPSGAVTVSWEADNASASTGGFFNISRKLPGATGFSFLTGTPGSTSVSRRISFTDFSVPTSAAGTGVQYIMTGRRGILMGEPSDSITVQFGVDGGGMMTASIGQNDGLKMAA